MLGLGVVTSSELGRDVGEGIAREKQHRYTRPSGLYLDAINKRCSSRRRIFHAVGITPSSCFASDSKNPGAGNRIAGIGETVFTYASTAKMDFDNAVLIIEFTAAGMEPAKSTATNRVHRVEGIAYFSVVYGSSVSKIQPSTKTRPVGRL
jgi:hypothetical protein